MEKKYMVYTLKVANALVDRGYNIVGTGINFRNPKYRIFYFEDTQKLREEINEIISSQNFK